MKCSMFSSMLLAGLSAALPTAQTTYPDPEACDVSQRQFYLITTAVPLCNSNSSLLPMVSATSTFAPLHQAELFLRTIGEGYNSLPVFTLDNGSLKTYSTDAFGQGNYSYTSTVPTDGGELQLVQGENASGLALKGGFLLGVGEVTDQWRLCEGAFGNTVIKYKATDPGCNATYIQAVAAPPY